MKNRFYMHEFKYHDGECYVTFNIVDLNELKNEISVAITREGKISVVTYYVNKVWLPYANRTLKQIAA